MDNPQNPIKNREIGPVQSKGPVGLVEPASSAGVKGGALVFTRPNPHQVIADAIAAGDTMEKRNEQLRASFKPEQK